MKKYLVLLLMVVAVAPVSYGAKSEPIPPEFPPADGAQLPEEGPEVDNVGQESYEQDPEQGEGGMIGEVFRTVQSSSVKTTTKKEDRGDVVVYTVTTQQNRGTEVCVITTVTTVHKATEKVLSSNTDSACYNYNY